MEQSGRTSAVAMAGAAAAASFTSTNINFKTTSAAGCLKNYDYIKYVPDGVLPGVSQHKITSPLTISLCDSTSAMSQRSI